MPSNVIALSVQNGSAGYTIARHVADALNFRYYDWEITSEAARLAGVPPSDVVAAERVPSFFERTMRRLGAISTMTIEGSPGFADPSPDVWNTALQSLTSDDYRQFIEAVVKQLASDGEVVIVGHAGQCILRDRPGVLKAFIHGSLPIRAERHAREQNISLEEAERLLKQSDKDRRNLMKAVYRIDWADASNYDITLNTDHFSEDWAVDAIVSAAREMP
jgi:cytidylate kinase